MEEFTPGGAGELNVTPRWIHGARSRRRCTDPPLQVHVCDEHTIILRQSKAISYEAPFLYLLFGNDAVLLLDTGATKDATRFPLRETVDACVQDWLTHHPRERYRMVVAHTHSHGDHIAGDGQFADRPDTVVVGTEPPQVAEFFGIESWPEGTATLDLGGRVLDVLPIPGHQRASVALYDPWTCWLLTGDTVYPGRLYVPDFPAFLASLDRLVDFADRHEISHVLGTHIEMTSTPGRDYPIGTSYQPHEAPLPMTVAQLRQLRDRAARVADRPGAHQFDDLAIYHGRCTSTMLRQVARSQFSRLAWR